MEVLPVVFLQSSLICWRARLYPSDKLSRFVLLLIMIEAVARVVLTFNHPTLSINIRISLNIPGAR